MNVRKAEFFLGASLFLALSAPSYADELDRSYQEEITEEDTVTQDLADFHFTVVEDAPQVLVRNGALVKEQKETDARTVAISKGISKASLLSDEKDGWLYIESGDARGFIETEAIIEDTIASVIGKDKCTDFSLLLSPSENMATTYTDATAQNRVVKGICMKASATTDIKESPSETAKSIGRMQMGSVCYTLEDPGNEWVYVESGDVRGFASKKALVSAVDAGNETVAEELVSPNQNRAYLFSMKSTREGNSIERQRKNIVEFALQFIGTPYVWGGTSLTSGADCSGFVQSVYANFGIYLPRVACDQALSGKQISVAEAQPGDLVFYAYSGGYIGHVALYIGDGQIVHASSSSTGIVVGNVGNACRAVDLSSFYT